MRRAARIVVVAAALAATFASVGPAPEVGATTRYLDEVFPEITTTKDIVYGQAVNDAGVLETLTLDVHEPKGDTAAVRAAVVWVHGGFFKRGTKESYPHMWSMFAKAGYVTVSINYRLRPDVPEPLLDTVTTYGIDRYIDTVRDAQHDAQAAIRWVRAHAAELRIDPDAVAIVGHSAGGLTTNMVAFNDHDPGSSGNPGYSSRPSAAVAMAGGSLPIRMVRIDPMEPPFLVVHGLADTIVPAVAFPPSCAFTLAMGNVCEMVLDPDEEHETLGLPQIREFLYRHMIATKNLTLPTKLTLVGTDSLFDALSG